MAEPGDENTRTLCFGGNTIGIFDLAENLPFTKDKRINRTCHFKDMTSCSAVKTAEKVFRTYLFSGILEGDQILLEKLSVHLVYRGHNVQLSAVTGRYDHGFVGKSAGNKAGNELLVLNFRKGDSFTDFNRCGFVIDTN